MTSWYWISNLVVKFILIVYMLWYIALVTPVIVCVLPFGQEQSNIMEFLF